MSRDLTRSALVEAIDRLISAASDNRLNEVVDAITALRKADSRKFQAIASHTLVADFFRIAQEEQAYRTNAEDDVTPRGAA